MCKTICLLVVVLQTMQAPAVSLSLWKDSIEASLALDLAQLPLPFEGEWDSGLMTAAAVAFVRHVIQRAGGGELSLVEYFCLIVRILLRWCVEADLCLEGLLNERYGGRSDCTKCTVKSFSDVPLEVTRLACIGW